MPVFPFSIWRQKLIQPVVFIINNEYVGAYFKKRIWENLPGTPMVKIKMYKQTIIFIIFTFLLCTISSFAGELFIIKDCVLSNSCNSETSKLKKHLLHATGMFEVLDDPYSTLDEIKLEFYELKMKNKNPIHIGVVYMWADHSIFVLNPTKGNNHSFKIVQIINFGRINNITIICPNNVNSEPVSLTINPVTQVADADVNKASKKPIGLSVGVAVGIFNKAAPTRITAKKLNKTSCSGMRLKCIILRLP